MITNYGAKTTEWDPRQAPPAGLSSGMVTRLGAKVIGPQAAQVSRRVGAGGVADRGRRDTRFTRSLGGRTNNPARAISVPLRTVNHDQ